MEGDFECEPVARLSGDERARSGAGRAARPAFAGFDAGPSIGWSPPEVDFIRRQSRERHVGTMPVVPREEETKFRAKIGSAMRNQDPSSALVLHGPDEAFDHCDASVLSNGDEPRANSLASAPVLEVLAPEGAVLVANQILGHGVGPSDRFPKERAHGERLRPLLKGGITHRASRVPGVGIQGRGRLD